MAKLPRVLQRIFGSSAGTNQIAEFGSLAAGSPTFTTSVSTIQSLSNWLTGWFGAVIGSNSPAIEDMNAFCFVITSQLAEIFQDGVPPWETDTIYYYGSIVSSNGVLYVCINDSSGAGQNGKAVTNQAYWTPVIQPAYPNALLNGAFDFWQRGTSIPASYNATATFVYGPDRWCTWDWQTGSGSVITMAQESGVLAGSVFGLQVSVTTAPGSATTFGASLFQILDVIESQAFYNQSASFSANIKAVGNVTSATIAFVYATGLTNVAQNITPISAGETFDINSSTFTLCQLIAQAIGTAMTMSGVIGIQITASTVSTGNLSDSGNGFIIEQAMMVPNAFPVAFSRQFTSQGAELAAAQRYYETSSGDSATLFSGNVTSTDPYFAQCNYKTTKRASVSPVLTNVNNVSFSSTPGVDTYNVYGFRSTRDASATSYGVYEESFTDDAEIY